MQGRFRCISLYMQCQQGFEIYVEDCLSQAFYPLAHRPCFAYTMMAFVQDLFLGVDGLSPVQWHPYSTVGGDGEHTLVAHIKAYGKWVPVHALCSCARPLSRDVLFRPSSTSPTQIP